MGHIPIVVLCALLSQASALSLGKGGVRALSWEETLSDAKVDLHSTCAVDIKSRKITVHSQTGTKTPLENIEHPVLCEMTSQPDGKVHTYDSSKLALVSIYDSDHYIHKDDNYWTLINKLTYSEKTQRPMFVWVGNLDHKYMCGSSLHFYKPLAESAIMKFHSVPGVVHLDADAWISYQSRHDVERYLALAPDAEVFFTQGRTKPHMVLMNGGLHILKNTDMGRKFAAGWWDERCGPAAGGKLDQPSLWLNTFKLLQASSGGKFHFKPDKMHYKTARNYHFKHFKKEYHNLGQTGTWNCKKDKCWGQENEFLLKEPIQFGKFLVMPARSMNLPSGGTLQGMHQDVHDVKAPTFCCHSHSNRKHHFGQPDDEPNECKTQNICKSGACGGEVTKLYGLSPGQLS